MKSLQKIQFLELHLLQMKHLLHHKLLQNNQSLHLIRLLVKMLMMKWIILLLAQKEIVVMIALMRNQIVLEQKSLLLVPQPAGRMALLCQKEGKGEIYQRSLTSLLTLLNLEEGSPVREISLPDGIPDLQLTQMKDPWQENRGLMGEIGLPYGTLMVKTPGLQISLHT